MGYMPEAEIKKGYWTCVYGTTVFIDRWFAEKLIDLGEAYVVDEATGELYIYPKVIHF